jgi:hypothetical protein
MLLHEGWKILDFLDDSWFSRAVVVHVDRVYQPSKMKVTGRVIEL